MKGKGKVVVEVDYGMDPAAAGAMDAADAADVADVAADAADGVGSGRQPTHWQGGEHMAEPTPE